ncbi:MAG: HEAT repeat domain-containing protein [Acidobacteriota bacterium]|nr:HEAT repeat domain-containing protein [Acidobacteriota bacterium]
MKNERKSHLEVRRTFHNIPEVKIATPEVKRLRASGPILMLAVLFVAGAFLTWYFTWFGRDLSDADISHYLVDEKHPRRVQHALLQIQQRVERGDPAAKQWYPQIVGLASHPETEFRLTAAWLMGFDSRSEEFHQALLQLVRDPEPIVRRNAALALVRFADPSGRPELVAMLSPHVVTATEEGEVASTLKEGSQLARGTLLARIARSDKKTVEVRSPLPGKLDRIIAPSGSKVVSGAAIVTINSDEDSIWEALRGLALIGEPQDVPAIESYAQGSVASSDRIKQQAALTIRAIRSRAKQE